MSDKLSKIEALEKHAKVVDRSRFPISATEWVGAKWDKYKLKFIYYFNGIECTRDFAISKIPDNEDGFDLAS